jgi:hypothetical protein
MAGIAYVRKRLWNPQLIVDPTGLLPVKLKNRPGGKNRPVYEIRWIGGTQAAEELGTAAASAKDGTAAAFQITVVSSSATDIDTAAGKVRAVALIGVSVSSATAYVDGGETPLSTVEVVLMNGTADVLSTRFYLWVDHAYAVNWGSGGADAEGNITIESPANTELLKITATFNESDGGTWHFPPGFRMITGSVRIEPTAALAAGDGVVLSATYTGFDQTTNTNPDLDVDYYTYIHYGGGINQTQACDLGRYTTISSKVLWSEALVANTQTIQLHIIQGLIK